MRAAEQICIVGSAAIVAPLSLSGSPAAVFSALRLSTWSGKFARVVRASDSAEMDVAFKNNVPDYQAVVNWAGGSAVTYKKLYDQSGNGNDLIQNTAANQPSFSITSLVNGIMPVIFDGVFNSTGKALVIPSSLSLARTNFSMFMAIRQVISLEFQNWFEFTNGATTLISDFIYGDPGSGFETGVDTFDSVSVVLSGVRPRGLMITLALRSNGSNQIFTINGTSSTQAATTSTTMNTGGAVGTAVGQPVYNLKGDLFALVFYASSVNSAIHDQVLGQFNSNFAVPQSFTTRLVYGGSSLLTSHQQTFNQGLTRKILMPTNVEIYNMGRTNGQTLATEFAQRTLETGLYDATKTVNIFVIDAPSNDIANHANFADAPTAQAFADTLYTNTTLAFVTAIKALGASAKPVVPTIISRGGFDTTTNFFETCRIRYNSNVTGGAVANGYTATDRASNANLGAQAACLNLTYFNADTIHPNDTGMTLLAAIDRAAILPLVA